MSPIVGHACLWWYVSVYMDSASKLWAHICLGVKHYLYSLVWCSSALVLRAQTSTWLRHLFFLIAFIELVCIHRYFDSLDKKSQDFPRSLNFSNDIMTFKILLATLCVVMVYESLQICNISYLLQCHIEHFTTLKVCLTYTTCLISWNPMCVYLSFFQSIL